MDNKLKEKSRAYRIDGNDRVSELNVSNAFEDFTVAKLDNE